MKTFLFRKRQIAVLFVFFILAPSVTGMFGIGVLSESVEKRRFADWPPIPVSLEQALSYSARIDDYLQDRFGMKRLLLFLPALKYYVGGERIEGNWIIGRDRWLFTAYDGAIPKHLGKQCMTPAEGAEWVKLVKASKDATERLGGRFLLVIAPDKQSIYPEYLPKWVAHNPGKCDRYLQAVTAFRSAGIAVVDARAALLSAKKDGRVYFKNDTHWNDTGAYTTYLSIRNAFGWAGAVPDMEARRETKVGGDIIGALNLDYIEEPTVTYVGYLPKDYENPEPLHNVYSKVQATFRSHILPGAGNRGRVLIVGDSYSIGLRKFLLQEAREVAWTDRRWGREQDAIKKLRPNWVVMEIAERLL